jgi:hypothetical protein
MLRRSIVPVALLVCLAFAPRSAVSAQERITIEGDVKVGRGNFPNQRLEVVLMSMMSMEAKRGFTDQQGKFSFFGVNPGDYRILVKAPYKGPYEDGTAEVHISRTFSTQTVTVSVLLEEAHPAPSEGPKIGTVAVGEAQESIPREAKKLYENGAHAASEGNIEEAVAFFRRALEIAPNYLYALNDLGAQLLKLDRLEESIAVLRKAVEIAPRSYSPRMNLAVALLSSSKPAEAQAEIAVALAERPDEPNTHYVSGQIERALGNRDKAIAAFDKALLTSNGRLLACLIHLGKLYEETGNLPKAIEAYQTYLAAAADGPSASFARDRLKALGSR